jgi:HEAT repeat protein
MSEKTIAGMFGALGALVLIAGVFLFAGRAFLVDPPDGPAGDEAETTVGESDPDADPVGPTSTRDGDDGGSRQPGGEGMDRVPDPSKDDVEYFDVTYEKLHAALKSGDLTELRRLVDLAHGQVDPRIIGELVEMLADKSKAYVVAGILGRIRTEGLVDALHDFIQNTDAPIARRAAIQALAEGGKEKAVPALLTLMQGSSDRGLVALTATALGKIGTTDAVEGILRTLARGSWPGLAGTLQNALAQVRDERALGLVVRALEQSGEARVQSALISALGQTGSPFVVDPLLRFVKNAETAKNVDAAARGVQALGMVGTQEALQNVLQIAKTDGPLQNAARYALRNSRDPAMLPSYLQELDSSGDQELRRSLFVAIGKLRDKSATPRLVDALRSPAESVDTRIAAAKGLAEMRDPASIPALTEAVKSDAHHVNLRISAVRALERIGDPKTIPVLQSVLEGEGPENFKAMVRYSINRIRLKRPPAPRDR